MSKLALSMKHIFILLTALLLTPLAAPHAAEAPRKWNVLFLMADDWRPEMGCYGTPGMISPNVDKLAASGVRFDRAYCQFPVCNPSRTSLLTGRYPTQTGNIFNGEHHFRAVHPDFVTLPQYFKQHGYITANSGKVFHGKAQDPPSWTEWIEDGVPAEARRAAQANAKPDNDDGAGAAGVRQIILAGDGESDKDYWIAVNGIKLLEKYKDQPFFIAIGFHRPHAIPTAPQKYFDLYDAEKMPLPPDFAPRPTLPKGIPATALPKDNDPYMNDEVSPQTAREVIRAYRASATWVDWNFGRVLDALDRLGLADKTIVVLLADHGYHNGEKGRWGKTTVFEVALRVPLIIRLPGAAGNSRVCTHPVQSLDLYPTLVELCGLPPAEGVQGNSLAALLQKPEAAWPHGAFSMARTAGGSIGYSVRTEQWHYAEWKGGADGAVLFDPARDPYEMTNIVANVQYTATIAEMKSLLAKAFVTMPSRIPAPPRVPAAKHSDAQH